MKKRSVDILLDLLESRKRISLGKLSKHYHVSDRTLRKDIQDINDFLETIGQCDIRIDDKGNIILDESSDYRSIYDGLYKIDLYMYRMVQEERCIYIIVLLTNQMDYITMEKIAEELFVSRLTIISDIELVKQKLGEFGITIKTKSSKGILLQYEEENLRLMLMSLFHKVIINVRNEGIFQRIVLQKMNEKHPLAEFVKYIQHFEKKNALVFNESVFYQNALYLSVAFNRMAEGRYIKNIKKVDESEDNYAEDLLNFTSYQIDTCTNENEKKFYKQYVIDNHLEAITKNNKDAELSSIIIYFLTKIGNIIDVPFQEDQLLIQSLLQHIKSVGGQGELYIDLEEEEVPLEYHEILGAVNKYAYILELYLNESLTDSVVKALVIHICASLIRSRTYIEKLSVLISCPGSVATGKLLEAQVKNYFNFNIAGVVPVRYVYSELESKDNTVDFVISTVSIENLSRPLITVNPVLEIEDLNSIQKQAFIIGNKNKIVSVIQQKNEREFKKKVDNIMNDIERKGDMASALTEIELVVSEYRASQEERHINLKKMLSPDHILIVADFLSCEEAIRLAGSILGDEYYSCAYVEKMVENVKKYGPYIVLSPGVALAHAGVENGVYKEGLSLLVSSKGIDFDGDIKVYLLFCFCTRGGVEYLELFHEIMDLGRNDKVKTVIQKGNGEEVYKELIKS